MLFGLSLGLAVALVVFLKSGQPIAPGPEADMPIIADRSAPSSTTSAEQAEPADNSPSTDDSGTELSFYTELADQEVIVSTSEFDFGESSDAVQEVLIQAGSFPTTQAADSRRAAESPPMPAPITMTLGRWGAGLFVRVG